MATGSVCIAVVKGSYIWTPEKQGEERVWFGVVIICFCLLSYILL